MGDSLLALASGSLGSRGDIDSSGRGDHFLLVAGACGTGDDGLVRPLPGPAWTVVIDGDEDGVSPGPGRWVVDLYDGVQYREPDSDGLTILRFASLVRPGLAVLSAADGNVDAHWPRPLHSPVVATGSTAAYGYTADRDRYWWARTDGDQSSVSAVADQISCRSADRRHLVRVVAAGETVGVDAESRADLVGTLLRAKDAGLDELVNEHRAEWSRRWDTADIEIDGDADAQLAIRFALYHVLSCAPTSGEAAVGARGLTGLAYAGHVFWDTEAFVLPALAATLPDAARAVIRYRTNRLAVARDNAADLGFPGARFPWESACSGRDVTPRSVRNLDGDWVPILTGNHAEHINSAIAWSINHYLAWTSDQELLGDGGRDVVLDTARYLQHRVATDHNGRGHLFGVVGPDEYHGIVDDNAYTNGMARWHLRWAAALARNGSHDGEADGFARSAACLVDGFDAGRGCHEQFRGFWELEPLLIGDFTSPPVAADVLLGPERVKQSQVIKQPDVLMLHHLLGEVLPHGSLGADLDCYLPLTAHGSSLSPAICAALIARAGRPDDAMALFDIAARLDTEDLTGTSAGGLHLANLGALWQAVVFGFAGIRPTERGLTIDPHLPSRWNRLVVRLQHQGTPMLITIDHESVAVTAPREKRVCVDGQWFTTPTRHQLHRREGSQP